MSVNDARADLEYQLAEQIRLAAVDGQTLRIEGGGSRRFSGRNPVADGVISTKPLTGVMSYEPSELVLRVGAGTPIHEVNDLLAASGQCLAFEPVICGEHSTIGGTVATAMAGAARPWVGGVKDYVLGVGLINGHGQKLNFGGQVMKNVAGYDVSRAMVGSLGCFGLITDVSLKVLPKSQSVRYVEKACTLSQALEFATELDRAMNLCSGFSWHAGRAYMRFAGSDRAIDDVLRQLRLDQHQVGESEHWQALNSNPRCLLSNAQESEPGAGFWRIVAPSYTSLSDLIDERRLLMSWAGAEYFCYAAGDEMGALSSELSRRQCHAYSLDVNDTFTLNPLLGSALVLHKALKKAFDPKGVLNPRRMSEAF